MTFVTNYALYKIVFTIYLHFIYISLNITLSSNAESGYASATAWRDLQDSRWSVWYAVLRFNKLIDIFRLKIRYLELYL